MSADIPAKSFLRNFSLPRVLIHLNRKRATGTLSVTAQGMTKQVFFQAGNAIFASSTYEEDRLGEMLVKTGKLTLRQYDEAVGAMKRTGKRLGALLVELGHLSPRDIFDGVVNQVREIILSLFRLKDGLYEFREGDIPEEVITLDLSMANIIYEGVKRIDEWTRIKAEMPGPDTVFVFSSDPRSLFQSIELGENDRAILSLLDGERSIKQVVEASGLQAFEVMKSLYILSSIGMITDQFAQEPVRLGLADILAPVEDKKEEFVARVESIHRALGTISHYRLLAVEPGADIERINEQYYRLTKEFHPDRYGSSLEPEVKDKICEVFDAITYAYVSLKDSQTSRHFSPGDLDLARVMLKNGKAEIKNGDFQRAADYLTEAVEADPENEECWNYLSLAYTRIPGKLPDAEEAIRRALRLNPENSDYHANLGLVLLRAERQEDAMKEFERALSLDPGNSRAQKGLSRLLAG